MLLFVVTALTTMTLLMLCPPSAHAQGGVPLWTNRFDGGFQSFPNAIAVDNRGNVFVTGYSVRSFGEAADYATIKYSSAGVPLWTNGYNGPMNSEDGANAIALDSSGNVFVTGYSVGDDGLADCATIKYSNEGVPVWTNRYSGPSRSHDVANAIAVDSNGDIFVTGSSQLSSQPVTENYVTIKYSNTGVPLWTNLYIGPGNFDRASAIAVNSSGNVFVTGISTGGSSWDYATVAYSSTGVPLWTNRYNGSGNSEDAARALAVDDSGNVFVTGESYATINGNADWATVAYSNSGVPLCTNRYNGPANKDERPSGIAVDGSGNVFVAGEAYATISGNADWATVAYSNSGVPLWTNRYSGPLNGDDVASAIAVDRSGNVLVTGSSWNGTNYDYVTIKYSSSVPPPRLDFQLVSSQLVLSWTNPGFNLQSAPALTGSFTNLPGATSPYTNPIVGPQQFFRLKED